MTEKISIDVRGAATRLTLNRDKLNALDAEMRETLLASQAGGTLERQVGLEDRSQVICLSSGDPGEGSRAFLEKRDPEYSA